MLNPHEPKARLLAALQKDQPLTLAELGRATKLDSLTAWMLLSDETLFKREGKHFWLAGEARTDGSKECLPLPTGSRGNRTGSRVGADTYNFG